MILKKIFEKLKKFGNVKILRLVIGRDLNNIINGTFLIALFNSTVESFGR
jgi:hypothetical protein